jgi:EAL domain-containing protein (putative c-di-GMP-specific phosphodiesterase class I)
LLRNADAAMYRAKEKRGNDFQFYSSDMNDKSLELLEQEEEMRLAIENDEFFLVYQPQLDMVEERLVAVEALIRWQHPTKGVLLPLDFIPQAEETGLIVPISEWILRKACIQNKTWQEQGLPPIRIAVNVSAAQFKQQNLIATVQAILAESGLDAKYLELELTENVIISNIEVLKTVEKLKALGVMLTIDDFGTGYSSLSYLHKIPLDRLKIDSSFIKNIQSPQDDEVIVRAVIAIAKNLKLEVMAEGVQNIDQLNFLKKYDCEEVQGYYFSEPLSTHDLQNLMKNPDDIKKMKPVTK